MAELSFLTPDYCVRQNNVPQRYTHASPWNLWLYSGSKGKCRKQIELRLQMRWPWEKDIDMIYPSESYKITWPWDTEEGSRRVNVRVIRGEKDSISHFWHWRCRKGRQVASEIWKRQENRFSPEASRRSKAQQILDWRPILDTDLQNGKIINLCFEVTKFMMTCHSSRRRLKPPSKWKSCSIRYDHR